MAGLRRRLASLEGSVPADRQFRHLTDEELAARIAALRERLGERVSRQVCESVHGKAAGRCQDCGSGTWRA